MKAFAILFAILFAWISGIGASDSGNKAAALGAVIFLLLSLTCGWLAWRI